MHACLAFTTEGHPLGVAGPLVCASRGRKRTVPGRVAGWGLIREVSQRLEIVGPVVSGHALASAACGGPDARLWHQTAPEMGGDPLEAVAMQVRDAEPGPDGE